MRPDARGSAALGGVLVRRATEADAPLVAAIEQRSFGDPWEPAAFVTLARNPDAFFLVAARRAQPLVPIGYLVGWFVLDEGEVANVAVAPEARGLGVGALLLDAMLAESRRRAVATLFLEVRESNAPARALYASRGFLPVGRRRRYYRHPVEDALVLRCDLAAHGADAATAAPSPAR